MADGLVRIRAGEKRPLYGKAVAASGTLTISGSPTVTLYDSTGTGVGTADQAATGYDSTALATVRVWCNLDTTSSGIFGTLAAGWYRLVFKFSAAGSDSLTRNYLPEVAFQIYAKP